MKTTLRWWLLTCVTALMVTACWNFGFIALLQAADVTKIGFVIIGLYVLLSAYIGYLSYNVDMDPDIDIRRALNSLWFSSDSFLTLGMIGTVIGFIIMLGASFSGIDLSDTATLKDALVFMALGMSTAMYTTLVGLICSQLLKMQLVSLEAGKTLAE